MLPLSHNRISAEAGSPPRAGFACRTLRAFIVISLLTSLSGCAWPGLFRGQKPNWILPNRRTCVLDNPTQTEIVDYLNESIARVPRWRCNEVSIKSRGALGIPITLRANIAVEERRNFRLVAQGPGGGTEVDLGSNEERFWFYARQSERPGVYTCRHELIDEAQRDMPLPLNPEWFTEVLGVVPFENSEVTMKDHERNGNWKYLVRDRKCPEGTKPMQLVTLVDCCQGLIIEQRLQETNGPVIAFARMRDFKKHPGCESRIPYTVDLEWPQAKMGLSLHMNRIDISQSPFASQLFDMPQIASVPVHEYSGNLARNRPQTPRSERNAAPSREFTERGVELRELEEDDEFNEDEAPPPAAQVEFSRSRGRSLPRETELEDSPPAERFPESSGNPFEE